MHHGTGDLRKRLASWVAEKISGKRYAPIADAQIDALRQELTLRGVWRPVDCWCEACDGSANAGFRTRMNVCNVCGDKRCPRAAHHSNECSKPPNGVANRSTTA